MKKALIVNPYWDSLGGGERYTASFIKLLLELGWQVDVIWPNNISAEIQNRFGVDISSAIFNSQFSILNSAKYDLMFWVSDGSLPTSFASKTIIHFQFPFKNIGGMKLTNLLKSRFYTFVANSHFTKSFIDSEFGVDCHVIYPPIRTSLFTPGTKTNTMVYVGRFSHLTQAKNPHLLIESFRKIHSQLPKWELVLAGGTGVGTQESEMAKLQSAAEGLKVKIVPNPNLADLKKLYAKAKIFWSAAGLGANEAIDPIKVEHFGITVVEAMSAGCVPIIPRLGGHKEILTSGTDGFLYDSLDQLEELTLKLAKDKTEMDRLSTSSITRSKIFDTSEFESKFKKIL